MLALTTALAHEGQRCHSTSPPPPPPPRRAWYCWLLLCFPLTPQKPAPLCSADPPRVLLGGGGRFRAGLFLVGPPAFLFLFSFLVWRVWVLVWVLVLVTNVCPPVDRAQKARKSLPAQGFVSLPSAAPLWGEMASPHVCERALPVYIFAHAHRSGWRRCHDGSVVVALAKQRTNTVRVQKEEKADGERG